MTDINHVVLVGRLTRDLGELRYGPSGGAIANLSVACNRSRKNGDRWVDEANFFDVTIYGKTAENLKQWLTKGKQICVSGYLQQQRWEKDGQNHSKVVVIADNVQLLGGGNGSGMQNAGGYANNSYSQSAQPQGYGQNAPHGGGFEPAPFDGSSFGSADAGAFPEDIPF